MRVWIGVLFALLVLPVFLYDNRTEAHLLRSDPDTLPLDLHLRRFAIREGAQEFAAHCAQCHGSTGTGDPARGIPNPADNDWLYGLGSVSEIERIITYGIRSDNPKAWNLARMPAYATLHPSATNPGISPLGPGQIRDVIEYLYFLQGVEHDAGAAVRGAAVYTTGGGCYDCHSTDARGDPAIGAPNLIDKVNLYGDGSREALFDSIAHGRQGVCPAWIDKITPAQVRETALYVYSLSHAVTTATPTH